MWSVRRQWANIGNYSSWKQKSNTRDLYIYIFLIETHVGLKYFTQIYIKKKKKKK